MRLAAASSGATSSASAPYLLPSWHRADLRNPQSLMHVDIDFTSYI
jgi:hypothetical protein